MKTKIQAKFSHNTKRYKIFTDAWYFLMYHPAFKDKNGTERFQECLDIHVATVNPTTHTIDDYDHKNTLMEVWLECGAWLDPVDVPEEIYWAKEGARLHDIHLDCGDTTFEKAIVKLAKKVIKQYGDYSQNNEKFTPEQKHKIYAK